MSSKQKKQRQVARKQGWLTRRLGQAGVSVSVRDVTAQDIERFFRPAPPGTWGYFGPKKR